MRKDILIYFYAAIAVVTIVFSIPRQNNLRASESNVEIGTNEIVVGGSSMNDKVDNGTISKANQEKVKEYQALLEQFSKSNYRVEKGKVIKEFKEKKLSTNETKEMKIIDKVFATLKGRIKVPEGAKIVIQEKGDQSVVIFENKLPKGTLGGDYSAKVTIDSKSGEILEILGSD